jgi:phosphomannomutase/phosphoglucomutase
MKAKVLETGAPLAGELSGHFFFADRHHGYDDAGYAALRLAEILAKEPGRPLSARLEDWPETAVTPERRVRCPDEAKFDVVRKVRGRLSRSWPIVDIDGVRVLFEDGWGLLRASNTEPDLVLRFEARDWRRLQEIEELVTGVLEDVLAETGG